MCHLALQISQVFVGFSCLHKVIYFVILWFCTWGTRQRLWRTSKLSMTFMNEKFEYMAQRMKIPEDENSSFKLENKAIKSKLDAITEKLREQDTRIDDQEQYIRRECLEIKGIPYIEDVDTTKLVKSVAELAGVEINDEDISISHLLPASDKSWTDIEGVVHSPSPPPIIVKFVQRKVKDDFYRARFHLKGLTTNDLAINNIYIAENLTQVRKKLFKACLKIKRELNISTVSTNNGKIYVSEE